jgi:hypothetical protein
VLFRGVAPDPLIDGIYRLTHPVSSVRGLTSVTYSLSSCFFPILESPVLLVEDFELK